MKVLCKCKHTYQDKKYGVGVRIATPVNKSAVAGSVKKVRCTVCSKEHERWSE